MSIPTTVLRASLRQARTTLLRKYTAAGGIGTIITSVIFIAVLWFVRDLDFIDGAVMAGGFLFAGFLAFSVIAAAVIGISAELQTEREDGTLLRAKAVPHGMTGHLVAKLFITPFDALIPVLPMVVAGVLMLPGQMPSSVADWALFVVLFLLSVAAMMPWGAVLGSVFKTMMGLVWSMMAIYALAALSGLFFPLSAMPGWLQWLGQATPLYWIGHAFRAVLLPPEAAAAELGGEFRLGLALLILLAWAVVGLIVAPVLLRRMARRQSGSTVAAARDRVLSKGY
ncbi:ABC transporter permease [Ornithinimicrobium panacihumi]|uniref:ABC transporter permease n=1 Tax=Ornithinimicrobium panacihumi TaxID=2008449 RepID=UPI003F8AB61F